MFDVLSEQVGRKIVLLGNEAIVRGALEAGVKFATTYPGTPASEIGDTFSRIAKVANVYFEYSVNEKIALEAAAGAAFSGLKSLVSFKHFGLNVASDSLMPIAYVGTKGFVIVSADDPSCHSSAQSEQDSRSYARLAHIPTLEPANPQECKDMTKFAFELSEKFEIPVLIRLTTRVAHQRGVVTLGEIKRTKQKAEFVKNLEKFNTVSPHTIEMHKRILQKMEDIKKISEKTKFNFSINEKKAKVGVIVCGAPFGYVMEALEKLNVKLPVLKLGLTYPVPEQKISKFIKNLNSVLIVEELDPWIENEVKAIAKRAKPKLKIYGKGLLPKAGEYREEAIIQAILKLLKKKPKFNLEKHLGEVKNIKLPERFAVLCPGCPHRAAFFAVKEVCPDCIFGGDIGCYILGIFPPLNTQDFILSMGASIGVIHGINKATNQKTIAFIGDSTFFHAGMPSLLNTVFNKSNPLVIILDNRYTAMTGHQPHPGTGYTGMGEFIKPVDIEQVVRSFGIKNVKTIDPFDVNKMKKFVKKFLNQKKVSVIVAKRECQLMALRKMRRMGVKIPRYQINRNKCKKCGVCLLKFGCPAIYRDDGNYTINEDLCTGCGVCSKICPYKAIKVKK
jgi:indolepyruvate ferredoxin oxidoreductase alpha subunit